MVWKRNLDIATAKAAADSPFSHEGIYSGTLLLKQHMDEKLKWSEGPPTGPDVYELVRFGYTTLTGGLCKADEPTARYAIAWLRRGIEPRFRKCTVDLQTKEYSEAEVPKLQWVLVTGEDQRGLED